MDQLRDVNQFERDRIKSKVAELERSINDNDERISNYSKHQDTVNLYNSNDVHELRKGVNFCMSNIAYLFTFIMRSFIAMTIFNVLAFTFFMITYWKDGDDSSLITIIRLIIVSILMGASIIFMIFGEKYIIKKCKEYDKQKSNIYIPIFIPKESWEPDEMNGDIPFTYKHEIQMTGITIDDNPMFGLENKTEARETLFENVSLITKSDRILFISKAEPDEDLSISIALER